MASYSISRDYFDSENENRTRKQVDHNYNMLKVYPNLIHPIIQIQSKKRYMSAAFWNYTSTPINFVITLFTGLTAGQAGSNSSYLSSNTVFIMLFVCFILSTVNIFFKLKEKAELNFIAAKKYEGFDSKIQEVDLMSEVTEDDICKKIEEYKKIKKEIDDFNALEKIENVNYFTEFLYYIVQKCKSHRKLNLLYKHAAVKGSEIYENRNKVLNDLVLNGVITKNDSEIIESNLLEIQRNIKNGDNYGFLSSFFSGDVNNNNNNMNNVVEPNKNKNPEIEPYVPYFREVDDNHKQQEIEPYVPFFRTAEDNNDNSSVNTLDNLSTDNSQSDNLTIDIEEEKECDFNRVHRFYKKVDFHDDDYIEIGKIHRK